MARQRAAEEEAGDSAEAPSRDLAAENAALRKQLSAAETLAKTMEQQLLEAGVTPDILDMARDKMRAGLSREDAIQCARRQVLHDKAMKIADEEKRREAAIKAGQAA